MSDWTKCPHCGLSHSIRPDHRCPRCRRAPVEPPAGFTPAAPPVLAAPPPANFGTGAHPFALPPSPPAGSGRAAPPPFPSPGAPAAAPGKRKGLAENAASLVGVALGLGISRIFGSALLVPGVVCVLAAVLLAKVGPARARPFAFGASAIIGHAGWMIAGALVVGTFRPVALDLVLMSAGVAWLLAAPGLAPVIALLGLEVAAIAVNVLQLGSGAVNGHPQKMLLLHLILRAAAIVALAAGYRAFRKAVKVQPAAALTRVFG